mmetsp:Transcript_93330/g.264205  ORF Transcript_93330/g.264205 Transcript_93330/m.264205 type:complete len:410 (+) Transcript_93330:161-1390(+)
MARVVFVNDVNRSQVPGLLELLRGTEVISSVKVVNTTDVNLETNFTEKLSQVQFKVRPSNLNKVIKTLNESAFTSFDVLQTLSTSAALPRYRHKAVGLLGRLFPSHGDRLSTMEIHAALVSSSHFNFDHGIIICFASGFAAIGLLTDTVVNILAAFFVSPLMNMIMAATWGIVIRDKPLFVRGIRNMLIGACTAWFFGAVVAIVLLLDGDERSLEAPIGVGTGVFRDLSINTKQITSRGPPGFAAIATTSVVASLSGTTLALGMSTGISSALSGVTLAVSLLPPLVNSGMMTVLGLAYPHVRTVDDYSLLDIAVVSMGIYIVTVPTAMLFAFLTFKFKHVGGKSLWSVNKRKDTTVSHSCFFGRTSTVIATSEEERAQLEMSGTVAGTSDNTPLASASVPLAFPIRRES